MFSFASVKGICGVGRMVSRIMVFGLLLTTVCVNASDRQIATITGISDLQSASLVTVSAGYGYGMRKGMKLLAYDAGEAIAELIIVDVNEEKTETLIIDQFGQKPLMLGNQVKFKTINFAATWK